MKILGLLSVISMIAMGGIAAADCHTNLTEKTWDKTAAGYCKIFFPDCTKESLGKRLSYSREVNPEVICVGPKGEYENYYAVTIADANRVFGTEFSKIGVNYTDELSKWLFENCQKYCDDFSALKTEIKNKVMEVKADVSEKVKEIKEDVKEKAQNLETKAKDAINEIKSELKSEKEKAKSDVDAVKSELESEKEQIKSDVDAVKAEVKSETGN